MSVDSFPFSSPCWQPHVQAGIPVQSCASAPPGEISVLTEDGSAAAFLPSLRACQSLWELGLDVLCLPFCQLNI